MKENIDGEYLNGIALQESWFPIINADIFISHSRADKKLAEAFAGWLKDRFGLIAFIDSSVWDYVDKLLAIINDKYSNKRYYHNQYIYDHKSCNKASQHTNIMLLMALQNMIDKVESVFLLNTDQSISVFDDSCMNATYSPWIYSEMVCTKIIRKKPLIFYRDNLGVCNEAVFRNDENRDLQVLYEVPLEHLKSINENDLLRWCKEYEGGQYSGNQALNALYKYTHKDYMIRFKENSTKYFNGV